ncbi:hypothetical protein HDU76_012170 [Blyttiomyces sp. JEL0837]|nr:hypothetical protein HDU76_012170 [Blyttiomyces sp. JEL0837]
MIFATFAAFIALSQFLALAGGLWDRTHPYSFDHVHGLVLGGIWNYQLKGHYDYANKPNISWRDCIFWAKSIGNQIHAISYDTVNRACYLNQLPYSENIESTFGGDNHYLMYNTYVDSTDFSLQGARANLQWSDSLAQLSQNEVNQLSSVGCPNKDLSQGSNELAGSPAAPFNGADWCQLAIREWFNEGFNGTGFNHASQMTWNTTTTMGCAKATSADGGCISVVCHYDPIGNFDGVGHAPTFGPNLAG